MNLGSLNKPRLFAVWGSLYGVALSVLAFLAAGAGHGSYILMGVSSAPFGLLGVIVALFGTPVFWALMGFLVAKAAHLLLRRVFLIIMTLHYLSIPFILATEEYGDWDRLVRGKQMLPNILVMIIGLSLYLYGQVVIWRKFNYARSTFDTKPLKNL